VLYLELLESRLRLILFKTLSRAGRLIRRVLDWLIGLIATLHSLSSGLQAIIALSLFYTLCSSPF
jgi:hypothetical protein